MDQMVVNRNFIAFGREKRAGDKFTQADVDQWDVSKEDAERKLSELHGRNFLRLDDEKSPIEDQAFAVEDKPKAKLPDRPFPYPVEDIAKGPQTGG